MEYKIGKLNPLRMKNVPSIKSDLLYVIGAYYYFLEQTLSLDGPKVYGFHDPALQSPGNLLQKRIVKSLFPKFNLFHLLSSSQVKVIPQNSRYFLLENTRFSALPSFQEKFEKFTILFFGRHEESKGIMTLQNVAQNISSNIELNIAGSGNVPLNIPASKNNVHVLGFLNDKDLYYNIAKSHAVLFPSFSEASSLVAIQSLSNFTPLVYRDIPENSLLEKSDLCIKCHNDEDFLQGLNTLRIEYERDPQEYLEKCKKLPYILSDPQDYFNSFINNICSVLKQDYSKDNV